MDSKTAPSLQAFQKVISEHTDVLARYFWEAFEVETTQRRVAALEEALDTMRQRAKCAEAERDFYKVQYLRATGEAPAAPDQTRSGVLHPRQTTGV